MPKKEVGKVTHWYDKISVAVVKLSDALKVGDSIKVERGEEEFDDTVSSMQINHEDVESGKKGDEVAIKLTQKAKEGSTIYIDEE
jgi:putative protease